MANDVVLDTDDVRISFSPRGGEGGGEGAAAVVSFTGIGYGLGGIQREEFARSLSGDAVNDIYFVIDKNRSWYNSCFAEIAAALGPRLAGRKVHMLGNSMGGYGSLLFGATMAGCASSIAFCPQFSVNPSGPIRERRFGQYLSRISQWTLDSCVPSNGHDAAGDDTAGDDTAGNGGPGDASHAKFVFFGAAERADAIHAEHFMRALDPDSAIFFIEDCGHDVAAFIRDRGAMHRLLDAIINRAASFQAISAQLSADGVAHRCWRPAAG
jgi:pimeloyl-ACP methyl ester carboxylesterase